MGKLLLIGTTVLLMATSASAQSSMPRSIISGNQFCTYASGSMICIPHTPITARQTNCVRANYRSTLALQRCHDEMTAAQRGPKRTQ
jgi:hypothetical protein